MVNNSILYDLLTIFSAFSFTFLFFVDEFKACHIYIWLLIASSLVYKTLYIYYEKNNDNKIVYFANMIDYVCIFNLLWCHNKDYITNYIQTNNIYYLLVILSLINYKIFYGILLMMYLMTLYNFIYNNDNFLLFFYVLSGFLIFSSYYSYFLYGWNLYNSWKWHLSICICFLTVKMSYSL